MTSSQTSPSDRPEPDSTARGAWSVDETLEGLEILVTGTTGFLGKVYASMLLRYHPDLRQLHLLIRSKEGRSAEERFFEHIAGSPVFAPLREIYGEAFEEFIRETVSVVDGDIASEHLGLEEQRARELSDDLDLTVNCAGLTNFNPNLENALAINALSQDHFLDFLRLSDDPGSHLHVSTAFVAGNDDGRVPEQLPGPTRYPHYEQLGAELDARREIEDCLSLIDHAKQLAEDQERQSRFERSARERLRDQNLPLKDELFERAYRRARDRWLRNYLSDEGLERARHWGWPNIYTYTKSLGERILAEADDVDVCICRPAIIESSVDYPHSGWIQGVNTSGPLAYVIYSGHRLIPTRENLNLDLIPVDYVSESLIAIGAALHRDRHHPVYQLGSSDLNPVDSERMIELTQLASRRLIDRDDGMSSIEKFVLKNADSLPVHPDTFEAVSAPRVRKAAEGLKGILDRVPTDDLGGFGEALESVKGAVDSARTVAHTTEKFFEVFFPFVADNRYVFESRHYGELAAGLSEAERQRYGPKIADLEWREYWLDIHMPALAEHIFPKIDEKMRGRDREVYTYEDLRELFDAATRHFADEVAMQHHHEGVVERYTYRELRDRAERAGRVFRNLGVDHDVPVLLAAENRPQWGMAYFGILEANGVAVPVDADSTAEELVHFVESSGARVVVLGDSLLESVGNSLEEGLRDRQLPTTVVTFEDLFRPEFGSAETFEDGRDRIEPVDVGSPERSWEPPDERVDSDRRGGRLASLIYTSGTTGSPKGVKLTHENFTTLLSDLKSVFDIDDSDEFVSVLPLHHAFEFTCGFLLPLSEGATVTYLEELSGEELVRATSENRATALIGVPALWELLYRRLREQFADTHPAVRWSVEQLERANRLLRETAGVNVGPIVFGAVHDAFGGHLDYLISGGAALPEEVLEGFYGLGFDMYEGYGLTEAAPVLTVHRPEGGVAPGTVGRPLPEVDIDIDDPDADGVGEVVARGPNVMEGYLGREEETDETLRGEWLHTGDLGRVDDDGNLEIVGREKEVIVTGGGENVYPDELEDFYGDHDALDELSVVGLPDGSGGERVACLARPDLPEEPPEERREAVESELRDWFRVQGSRTAPKNRIDVLRFWYEEFPRTATRKIQRNEVVEILEGILEEERAEARKRAEQTAGDWAWLDDLLARVADVPPEEIHAGTHLYDELGFDSLMFVELAGLLEERGYEPTEAQLEEIETNQDLRELVASADSGTSREAEGESTALVRTEDLSNREWQIPGPVADAGRQLLYRAQMAAYDKLYDVEVYGRAHIPYHDPNVLVASNHCSHLDMGLVKYALGDFGRGIRALAAADYFFDTPARRAYFENFTNLLPIERSGSLDEALEEAHRAIERGETLLIFPEGTRSTDGTIQEFESGLGYLVDRHEIDVLPLYLDGTYEALPKGRPFPSPTARTLKVYIGDLLEASALREGAAALEGRERFEAISDRTREAITALRNRASGLRDDEALEPLFAELTENFDPERANGARMSFYFTLGELADRKWSVIVDGEECRIEQGKPEGGRADCVVKTSPNMFKKIVREGYVPSMDEFMSGDIKTNDPEKLRDFQNFFGIV